MYILFPCRTRRRTNWKTFSCTEHRANLSSPCLHTWSSSFSSLDLAEKQQQTLDKLPDEPVERSWIPSQQSVTINSTYSTRIFQSPARFCSSPGDHLAAPAICIASYLMVIPGYLVRFSRARPRAQRGQILHQKQKEEQKEEQEPDADHDACIHTSD